MAETKDALFTTWLGLWLAQRDLEATRLAEYRALATAIAPLVDSVPGPWAQLPGLIHRMLGPRGYAWNGIYARDGEDLRLVAAEGPPVCASLHRVDEGGEGSDQRHLPGRSGMCFDAMIMNQTLVASDVKAWPGYVSCDGESGLATVAGMVCPIRNDQGTPIAVWDLDAVAPLAPEDGPWFDALFATLSALLQPVSLLSVSPWSPSASTESR